jgi:hypothetical protein
MVRRGALGATTPDLIFLPASIKAFVEAGIVAPFFFISRSWIKKGLFDPKSGGVFVAEEAGEAPSIDASDVAGTKVLNEETGVIEGEEEFVVLGKSEVGTIAAVLGRGRRVSPFQGDAAG